ncbi:LuxR family transcriptional regulator [Pseudomonas syringae]|nr:LuxR family transcriptional regulator [Pseudomonas syringae]MCF5067849.1 LuxR family transcriptional regulator [Pseudomonas syringae]
MAAHNFHARTSTNDGLELNQRLKGLLEPHLKSLGECHYAYFITHKMHQVQPRIFSNYPKHWIDAYKAANYHLIDPVIIHGLKSVAPFSWQEALEHSEPGRGTEVFALSQRYRISTGFTFSLHDSNGLFAALSLCSNSRHRTEFAHAIEQQTAAIQMALIQLHDDLTASVSPSDLFPELRDAQLSDREMGVLRWVIMGKAYSEIAAIHAISVRTVKFHMSNIVDKLQVCNAKQAVYKAVSLGLLDPAMLM